MDAKWASVLSGHNTLATSPNFRRTILSTPGRNCPCISRDTTDALPHSVRMNTPPTLTKFQVEPIANTRDAFLLTIGQIQWQAPRAELERLLEAIRRALG